MVEHDVARAGVEGHHPAPVGVGELAIGDAADVQGENGADFAEGDEIEELHERRARSAERVFYGAELRHDRRVADRRDDRGFGDLQPARVGSVEPAADDVFVVGEELHALLIRGLLIDRLAVEADHGQILRRDAGLAHQRTRRFGIERSGDIVQPAEFEDRKLVFERGEHLVGDLLRPGDRLARDEARPLQQAVFADGDIHQHDVDAVERRPAVQAKRKHASSRCRRRRGANRTPRLARVRTYVLNRRSAYDSAARGSSAHDSRSCRSARRIRRRRSHRR